jgi:hypothetical protein
MSCLATANAHGQPAIASRPILHEDIEDVRGAGLQEQRAAAEGAEHHAPAEFRMRGKVDLEVHADRALEDQFVRDDARPRAEVVDRIRLVGSDAREPHHRMLRQPPVASTLGSHFE